MAIYKPQLSAIQIDIFTCEAKRQLYIGAQRSGKTFVFLLELMNRSILSPTFRGYYVGPNYPVMRPLFDQLVAQMHRLDVLASTNTQEHVLTSSTGGRIQFKTAEKPESIKGWDCDLVILDEASLCPETAFINCLIATNVRDGILKIGTNVPEPSHPGYDWVTKLYYEWSKERDKVVKTFPSWVNTAIYPERDHDPKILNLKHTLAEDVFERRIGADMRVLTGRVYHEFDPAKHVLREFTPSNCVIGIDPGFTNPAAVLFGSYNQGKLVIYDEVYGSGLTQADIIELCVNSELQPEVIVVDSEAPELVEQLKRHHWHNIPSPQYQLKAVSAQGRVHPGLMTVKGWFEHGRLFITQNCEKTLWELDRYMFGKGEKPIKVNDHAMDAMRYLVTMLVLGEQLTSGDSTAQDVIVLEPDPEIDALFNDELMETVGYVD